MSGKKISAAKASRWVLYGLLAMSLVAFGAFFVFAYGNKSALVPGYSEPSLTGVLIAFVFFILLVAIVVTIWSVVISLNKRRNSLKTDNHIPSARISAGVSVALLLLLCITYVLSPARSMMINGNEYSNNVWLKAADMFVVSAITLIVVAVVIVFSDYLLRRRK